MSASNTLYTDSYVCFLDILGFSNAIKYAKNLKYDDNEHYFYQSLEMMKKLPEKKNIISYKLDVTQCSDSVIISCAREESKNDNFMTLFDCIRRLQINMLNYGFATRGALTSGNLYHKQGVIFGPALVQAVHYEKNIARNPYVVCSEDVMQDIKNKNDDLILNKFVVKTENNFYYIDFFKYNCPADNIDYCRIRDIILDELRNSETEERTKKYRCLATLFNQSPHRGIEADEIFLG